MMTAKSKLSFASALLGASLLASPLLASAETVEGKMVGFECANTGYICSADKLDPYIQLESDFVLLQDDGQFYFLRNISRDTKVRYVLEDMRAVGEINPKYNSITVNELQVKEGGQYRTVWSQKLLEEERARIWGESHSNTRGGAGSDQNLVGDSQGTNP